MKKLTTILFAGLFILLLFEVYFRNSQKDPCEFDPTKENLFCKDPHPGIRFRLKNNIVLNNFSTNSFGRREQETGFAKRMIFGLGDGIMMGRGVGDEEHFMHLLSKKVKASYRNFSASGYNQENYYYLLQMALKEQRPDLVIINYVGNDFEAGSELRRHEHDLTPSYFLNYLILSYRKYQGELPSFAPLDIRPIPAKRSKGLNFFEAYQKMATILSQAKVKGLVVMDSRYENQQHSHRELEKFFKQAGFYVVNLMSEFRGEQFPHLRPLAALSYDDEHNKLYSPGGNGVLNNNWHRDVATLLSRKINSLSLFLPIDKTTK